MSPALAGRFFTTSAAGEAPTFINIITNSVRRGSKYWDLSIGKSQGCFLISPHRPALVTQTVKNLPTTQESPVGKIPWGRDWQPTPVFLPGEAQGQRSLVGYSPWSHKESDTTEAADTHIDRSPR